MERVDCVLDVKICLEVCIDESLHVDVVKVARLWYFRGMVVMR